MFCASWGSVINGFSGGEGKGLKAERITVETSFQSFARHVPKFSQIDKTKTLCLDALAKNNRNY